jgi:ketosteroid isomerase-like protein
MSRENVEIMRRAVEAFNHGGVEAMRDFYDPDVEYCEDPKFPEARVYRGRDSVVRQFQEFGAAFEEYRFDIEDLVDNGDQVIGVIHEHALGRTSGAKTDRRTGWITTLRAGRIVRLEIFLDPGDALEAAGLRE